MRQEMGTFCTSPGILQTSAAAAALAAALAAATALAATTAAAALATAGTATAATAAAALSAAAAAEAEKKHLVKKYRRTILETHGSMTQFLDGANFFPQNVARCRGGAKIMLRGGAN